MPDNSVTSIVNNNSTIVGLHVLYGLNIHANFHTNQIQFTILFINSYFMHYFKLLKLESRQLINDMAIKFLLP